MGSPASLRQTPTAPVLTPYTGTRARYHPRQQPRVQHDAPARVTAQQRNLRYAATPLAQYTLARAACAHTAFMPDVYGLPTPRALRLLRGPTTHYPARHLPLPAVRGNHHLLPVTVTVYLWLCYLRTTCSTYSMLFPATIGSLWWTRRIIDISILRDSIPLFIIAFITPTARYTMPYYHATHIPAWLLMDDAAVGVVVVDCSRRSVLFDYGRTTDGWINLALMDSFHAAHRTLTHQHPPRCAVCCDVWMRTRTPVTPLRAHPHRCNAGARVHTCLAGCARHRFCSCNTITAPRLPCRAAIASLRRSVRLPQRMPLPVRVSPARALRYHLLRAPHSRERLRTC